MKLWFLPAFKPLKNRFEQSILFYLRPTKIFFLHRVNGLLTVLGFSVCQWYSVPLFSLHQSKNEQFSNMVFPITHSYGNNKDSLVPTIGLYGLYGPITRVHGLLLEK